MISFHFLILQFLFYLLLFLLYFLINETIITGVNRDPILLHYIIKVFVLFEINGVKNSTKKFNINDNLIILNLVMDFYL